MTDPAPPPAAAPPPTGPSLGVGPILAIVGFVVVAISSWLDWIKEIQGASAESAHQGPAKFLIDNTSEPGGLSIGTLLLLLAVAGIVGALLAQVRFLALVGGAGGILVAALFMYQIKDLLDRLDADQFGVSFGDVVGVGAYLALIGGVVALIGGVLSLRST